MTEAEWDACADPRPMLKSLGWKASERKLRLFAVACCRRIWHLLADERSRKAIQVAERFADGEATRKERAKADKDNAWVWTENEKSPRQYGLATAVGYCVSAGLRNGEALMCEIDQMSRFLSDDLPPPAQAVLLREVFGPPLFRPMTIDPAWLAWNSGAVRKMARAIYDDRRFADLPILADALEDAGCADAATLGHCRGGGEHVRGCWVVDLLLGKS
jgi:hypothetical protein